MEVKYDKQRREFQVYVEGKLIRLDYLPIPSEELVECEEICPLAKVGIRCEKLRHPSNDKGEKWTLYDFCDRVSVDYDYLLEDKEIFSNFIPNYEDILAFYTSEEIEKAKN